MLEPAARVTAADYASALRLLRPRSRSWTPVTLLASSSTGRGVAEVWTALEDYRRALAASGELARRRGEQNRAWLWEEIRERVLDQLRADATVAAVLPELERAVVAGRRTPTSAADEVLARWRSR
jgi:LAO/AO transport system kinase